MQPGAAFPLNWPLFKAPLKDGGLNLNLIHWHWVGMYWLAAVFMYFYCRELERSRTASLLAACGFSFGGFVGTVTWPQVLNGAVWTPRIFLFYRRAGRSRTALAAAANSAACGAAIGMALLAGHHQVQMFVILALTGLFLHDLLAGGHRSRRLRSFTTAAAFAALVGGLILAPAWEYGSRAYRWVNLPEPVRLNQTIPYIGHSPYGVAPASLPAVLTPLEGLLGDPLMGVVAVSLALLGVGSCWRIRAVRVHACLALAGLAFVVGTYSVFHGLMYALVPFLDKARSASQALVLFHFGLLVAAAYGLDSWPEPARWLSRLTRGLAVFAVLAVLLAGTAAVPGRGRPLLFTAAIAILLAGTLRTRFRAAAVVLLLVELHAGTARLLRPRSNPQALSHLDRMARGSVVAQFLRSQPRPFRVDIDQTEIPHNFGDWEGLEAAAGYLAFERGLARFRRPRLGPDAAAAEPRLRGRAGKAAP